MCQVEIFIKILPTKKSTRQNILNFFQTPAKAAWSKIRRTFFAKRRKISKRSGVWLKRFFKRFNAIFGLGSYLNPLLQMYFFSRLLREKSIFIQLTTLNIRILSRIKISVFGKILTILLPINIPMSLFKLEISSRNTLTESLKVPPTTFRKTV